MIKVLLCFVLMYYIIACQCTFSSLKILTRIRPSVMLPPNWRYFVTCTQVYQILLLAHFDGMSELVGMGRTGCLQLLVAKHIKFKPSKPGAPFTDHGFILFPAWVSDYIHYKVRVEVTYSFPNFTGATVEVWECMNYFIPHFTGHVITYPCWDKS